MKGPVQLKLDFPLKKRRSAIHKGLLLHVNEEWGENQQVLVSLQQVKGFCHVLGATLGLNLGANAKIEWFGWGVMRWHAVIPRLNNLT